MNEVVRWKHTSVWDIKGRIDNIKKKKSFFKITDFIERCRIKSDFTLKKIMMTVN